MSKQPWLPTYSPRNVMGQYFHFNSNSWREGGDSMEEMKNIEEVAGSIRDALSYIVRTRDISVALKHKPSKCQTCVEWSMFDLGSEYGPFLVHSAIPKMLQLFIL